MVDILTFKKLLAFTKKKNAAGASRYFPLNGVAQEFL